MTTVPVTDDLRRKLALNPHRPSYHFVSGNWMNDPQPFFWDGECHVFYQYSPDGCYSGIKHWGHTVSKDLVRWQMLPVALSPTPGGPDQQGVWSGSPIRDGDKAHIFYTGIPRLNPLQQVQCRASSSDLIHWTKRAGAPLNVSQPDGLGSCFRDPFVWREGSAWFMVVGSELPAKKGGALLLYTSGDLTDWRYLGIMYTGDAAQTGHMFECPDFFPLGDRHVLLTSCGVTYWYTGRYADRSFTAEHIGVTDGGAWPDVSLYALHTALDGNGRRLAWGWIRDPGQWVNAPIAEKEEMGYNGALSLPRVLTLLPDKTLGMAPAPELAMLRGSHWHAENIEVSGDGITLLDGVQGDALEIIVRFVPSKAASFGVAVRCSPDLQEMVTLTYDARAGAFAGAPLRLEGELTLHIFVDRSVIESFANGRASRTLTVYPRRSDTLGVGLVAEGAPVTATSIDIWQMRSIGLWDSL